MTVQNPSHDARVISGPYLLFDGSFMLEILEPDPSLKATVLLRATYTANHELTRAGQQSVHAPPLHIHFDQAESFKVLRGHLGITHGYGCTERILSPADGVFTIEPFTPHKPWPSKEHADEETVILMWGHPNGVERPLDRVFFEHIFRHMDECHRLEKMPDLLQIMLMQHATSSAPVMLPSWTILGSLRWYVPWLLQGTLAAVARLAGYKPAIEKYVKRD